MLTIVVILIVVAAICFGLAAVGVPSRVSWVPLGLLAWLLAWVLVTPLR